MASTQLATTQQPPPSGGPLPKRDSVQSLVSLMSCGSSLPSTPTASHATIRGVDSQGKAHAIPVTDNVDAVSLSAKQLQSVSLGALASPVAAHLRQLSLAANALDSIDLGPLSWCPSLAALTLNSNRLTSIDLAPLAACKRLERLWLHDNCLETLDLTPLSTCTNLRSLYLEDNSLHEHTLDFTPLQNARNLRSLRLGGNKLGGTINLTPLLQCPALSVFNVDSSVNLTADGESSQARVSPALRRIVLDIKFNAPAAPRSRRVRGLTTPPISPPPSPPRKSPTSSSTTSPPSQTSNSVTSAVSSTTSSPITSAEEIVAPISPLDVPSPIVVKVLLVGFRRLARYAAEDSLSRCGKVIISASAYSVSTTDPSLLLDSHLIILYSPPEKTIRQVHIVGGQIPIVIVGTERYRSTADSNLYELLRRFQFFVDPVDNSDAKLLYCIASRFASGETNVSAVRSVSSSHNLRESERDSNNDSINNSAIPMRKSQSDGTLSSSTTTCDNIELEHIEDVDENGTVFGISGADEISNDSFCSKSGVSEVFRRLSERRSRRSGRGWGTDSIYELSDHGRNKLRAERSSIETAFSDLGGYTTGETFAGITRACGLAKCAAPLLFRSAFGSTFEVEVTTPEAGVPNAPMERKKRISCDAFLAYWDSRLKSFDGEERLSNVLEDSHFIRIGTSSGLDDVGHSPYGAPASRPSQNFPIEEALSRSWNGGSGGGPGDSTDTMRTDLWCPCDAGIEELIRGFMEGRSSRFGSYALVKLSEAVAIGASLVIYALRGSCRGRVGGHARAVCPREMRRGKLNAALIAAEVGIFEGVTAGLSMNQIRCIKGCFATEVAPSTISANGGCALSWTLSRKEVQHFCISRKTLLPGAVERVMHSHCRNEEAMSLSEFSILLCVLSDVSCDGAVDYFFTVVDVDDNDVWTVADLKQFHMEKERLWFDDGMAVSDLQDLWINLVDMAGIRHGEKRGVNRRDIFKLGDKDRKAIIQTLLYVDDDYTSVNIRRTMELNKNSTSSVVVI